MTKQQQRDETRKLYKETVASAWKLYEETKASAWKLYEAKLKEIHKQEINEQDIIEVDGKRYQLIDPTSI